MSINTILSLGIILLAGLAAAFFIRKIKIPTITAYILLGILVGPSALNVVSRGILSSSGMISNVVLSFIAFSLGQNFSLERFRRVGKSVITISICEVLGTFLIVSLGLWLLANLPIYIALIFGGIAAATDPAAVVMVTREYRARGTFTDTILGIVAIDDAWGIILFAFCLAIAKNLTGTHGFIINSTFFGALHAAKEIIGALALGGLLGWALSKLSRYITNPRDFLIYTIGFILLNAGLAIHFDLSVLLANMFLGAVLVNINKTSFKFFDALKLIDSPFYLLFFVLAGASLEIGLLKSLSLIGVVYIFARALGKIMGAMTGANIIDASPRIKKYMGLGLIPQAGVALALALIAKSTFSQYGSVIFSTIVATTIIYELVGPICTKYALKKAGEVES